MRVIAVFVVAVGLVVGSLGVVDHTATAAQAAPAEWARPGPQAAHEGDPEADAVVDELFATNQMDAANAALKTWRRNDQPIPAQTPEPLRSFLEKHRTLPDDFDRAAAERGFAFLRDNMLTYLATISFGELFTSLADPLLARAVWQAQGDLVNNPGLRLARTLGAIWAAAPADTLEPSGGFIPTTVKLRLIHAAARHNILAAGTWDAARDGAPISQRLELEELLLVFRWAPDRLSAFGIAQTDRNAEDVNQVGRLVGHMMGIKDEYLPDTAAQARQVLADVEANYQAESMEGRGFTAAMLDEYSKRLVMPGARPLVNGLVRYLVGPRVADILAVPAAPEAEGIFKVVAPIVFGSAQKFLLLFPMFKPLYDGMTGFVVDAGLAYAADWHDHDLQMPTGKPPARPA